MPEAGKQFKRTELPIQSESEVRKVIAAGREKAKAQKLKKANVSESISRALEDARRDEAATRSRETASEYNKMRPFSAAGAPKFSDYKPLSERQHSFLRAAQHDFETSAPGKGKEEARRRVGRTLQQGVPQPSSITNLACQSPGCNNSINLEHGADVVCTDCMGSGGDKSGAKYTDRSHKTSISTTRARKSGGV